MRRFSRRSRRRAGSKSPAEQHADALAAHLVASRGFAPFEELLDPELLYDLEAVGPYGLLEVPLKKLALRRQWWSSARTPARSSRSRPS